MTTQTSNDDETAGYGIEPKLLGASLLVLLAVWGFALVADEVVEGETRAVDEWILEHVRTEWVVSEESPIAHLAENITALGGTPVLVLVTGGVLGFLLLRRQFGLTAYLAVVTVGGSLIAFFLKFVFDRPRPTIVEPLDPVHTASFPSGHAMSAAFVYLTLGAVIAAEQARRSVKIYVLGIALLLAVLVGISRVMLAVHYPTDVIAGWMAGLAWALICWIGYVLLGRP